MRHCALGKIGRRVTQIVRYFQEKILWAHILQLLTSEKNTKIINGDICSLWLAASFCQKVCLIASTLLHSNHMYTDSPATSLAQFLRAPWNPVSRAIFLILPPVKLKSQLSCCAFFSVYRTEEKREGWEEERKREGGKKWRTEEGEKGEGGREGREEEEKAVCKCYSF